jgi:hypothetical protein
MGHKQINKQNYRRTICTVTLNNIRDVMKDDIKMTQMTG